MKCLNVIVLYNNYKEVLNYINETISMFPSQVDIALVVNSDEYGHLKQMPDNVREKIQIFDYGKNVGYLNALLYVIKDIDIEEYKYIILSNTDIEYQTDDFFSILLNKEFNEEIGCIAPSVYAIATGSYSNPHYLHRTPKRKFEFLRRIFSHPLLARGYLRLSEIKRKKKTGKRQDSCYVYSPHGCYMIFTKDFIKAISDYVYGTLLYSEEACIGELLLRYRKKCYYYSEIEVRHTCSTVTGGVNYKKRFKLWADSIDYILNEFYKDE